MMASVAAAAQAEKDQMQQAASPTLKPQSRSAVHYLAISPPRIRVTDAQGKKNCGNHVLSPTLEFTEKKRSQRLSVNKA